MEKSYLEVGKIINTHGLNGEIKVVSWMDYPELFEEIKKVYLCDSTVRKIKSVKYQKNNVILKLEGINSIDEAQSYKGSIIKSDRQSLGALGEDTYYIADLIGLAVKDDKEQYGVISDVISTGSSDVYVVKRADKKDLLIPAIKQNVIEVNLNEKYVKVKIPEGLLEL